MSTIRVQSHRLGRSDFLIRDFIVDMKFPDNVQFEAWISFDRYPDLNWIAAGL